ncbi:MAG: phosphonoacetaldehyde reductase [Candidatus Latescibacterota bacterium]|nr:phosphonoacetaldehyde reductase [Candidatus Latescibacterota bacterium]
MPKQKLPAEFIGAGRLSKLGDIFKSRGIRSCFLVADSGAYGSSGASESIRPLLETLETLTIFSDFAPNPDDISIERALGSATIPAYDAILAIGGGTAIDIAKLVSVSLVSGLPEVVSNPDRIKRHNTLIAAPTTAGTGSEATHFAVLYIHGIKHSIAHTDLLPDVSIVDPNLLQSLPSSVAAHTGLDALCQSIESYWGVHATPESRKFASEGLNLAFAHLENIVNHPDQVSRDGMARAAHLSGQAINISKTTASHALSYTLTSKFGIPHGLAVALTIGPCLVWNAEVSEKNCTDPGGVLSVKKSVNDLINHLSCKTPFEARDWIEQCIKSVGCPTRLTDFGITDRDIDTIAGSVNKERLANNPRRFDNADILNILKKIY